jgi:hypothetical protein
MDEVWLRTLAVTGVVGVVVLVARLSRRRRIDRSLSATGLDPGVYLFTSRTCGDCDAARRRLADRVGPDAYREVEWELEPGLFTDLAIDRVPSTLVVAVDGSGVWAEGVPSELGDP